jgi:Leucine-rich repeat (LRR) protein
MIAAKGKPKIKTWMAVILLIFSLLFMTASFLFVCRKPILRKLNNDRIIKKAIALSLLEMEHPMQSVTMSQSEYNNEQIKQKRLEGSSKEHFSHQKKPWQLTASDYKKIKELYISDPDVYDISLLSKLTNLEKVIFYNVKVRNLEPIAHLTNLKELELHKLPADNLEPLRNLKNLKKLRIYKMPIRDIEPLRNLTYLEEIVMYDVNVRNLDALFNLKNLKVLWLINMPVSDERVEELKKALPNLQMGGTE